MRVKLVKLWERLHASYWFIPAIMMVLAIGLAFAMVAVDRWLGLEDTDVSLGWTFEGGHEGAREVLGVIAASMIGVAGVTFSITIVAFSLAATQFGPRVLRNLMRDRGNQLTLGVFLATFVYAVLVQRTVRGGDAEFVPDTAVTVGVLLALASIGVLIYFIHHAAESIQAPTLLANVGRELVEGVEVMLGDRVGLRVTDDWDEFTPLRDGLPAALVDERACLLAPRSGYVQGLDLRKLLECATERDLVIRVVRRPGHFVLAGDPLLEIWPREGGERVLGRLEDDVVVGRFRTQQQDPMFALNQLVQVALRALSPSLNDPFTAMTALDWIGAGLARLVEGPAPAPWRYDDEGRLRVIADTPSVEEFAERALGGIRNACRDNPLGLLHLIQTVQTAANHATNAHQREVLRGHLTAIERDSHHAHFDPTDRRAVDEAVQRANDALQGVASPPAPIH